VRYAIGWSSALFLVLGALICLFVFGLRTGLRFIDSKTHGFIDLLVETEGELQKVSWPTRQDLANSTSVVLVCVVIIGLFLWVVDRLLSVAMSSVGVLPK